MSMALEALVVHVKPLTRLRTLGLSDCEISDAGLAHLTGLRELRNVSLLHAPVTDEGVRNLKKSLPQLDVYYK